MTDPHPTTTRPTSRPSGDLTLQRNNTFIHVSCKQSKFQLVVHALRTTRFTPNYTPVKDYSAWTALHWAASNGNPSYASCEALCLAGFSPNQPARNGQTPLELAQTRGHANIIELLEYHSIERVAQRMGSISKRCRIMNKKDGTRKLKKVKHLVPCIIPDMNPEEGYQTFDQLVAKFKSEILPSFKFPKSKYQ